MSHSGSTRQRLTLAAICTFMLFAGVMLLFLPVKLPIFLRLSVVITNLILGMLIYTSLKQNK